MMGRWINKKPAGLVRLVRLVKLVGHVGHAGHAGHDDPMAS